MFVISVIENYRHGRSITEFSCPKCGGTDDFLITQPIICKKCDNMLPDVESVVEDSDDRIFFHHFGRTMQLAGQYLR